jgi:hypothetical protein
MDIKAIFVNLGQKLSRGIPDILTLILNIFQGKLNNLSSIDLPDSLFLDYFFEDVEPTLYLFESSVFSFSLVVQ